MSAFASRRRVAHAALVLLTLGLASLALPGAGLALPASQVVVDDDTERWRVAEDAARAAADHLRPWPAAYEFYRPRPPYPGGALQRLYPWELLGSPFAPVWPLGEVRFAGILPDDTDYDYGYLTRHYLTPLAFRVNFREAEPYLNVGFGPAVLEAWARYLGRSTAELARPPVTAEEITRVIAGWLRDAGYLVEDTRPGGRPPAGRPLY